MKFNKLRGMLATAVGADAAEAELKEFLWNAVSKSPSDLLTTREDDDGVRWIGRSTIFVAREDANVDECTLYVERIPSHLGSIDALETVFEKYGKVVYVSLPRYKRDGKAKGFAFVQFDKAENAKNALDSLCGDQDSAGKSMEPGDLESIKSYQKEQLAELEEEQKLKVKRGKIEGVPPQQILKDPNSSSNSEDNDGSPPPKKIKSEDADEKAKKRKPRKRKKSSSGQVTGNGSAPPPLLVDGSSLRVMSKVSMPVMKPSCILPP